MRINCISCGHRFELDAAYDDYSGLVKCSVCRTMLAIAAANGRIRSVNLPSMVAPVVAPVVTPVAAPAPVMRAADPEPEPVTEQPPTARAA